MVIVSLNTESLVVLVETITGAAAAYISALPIPLEIKGPTVALIGSVAGAIFLYWRQKINNPPG